MADYATDRAINWVSGDYENGQATYLHIQEIVSEEVENPSKTSEYWDKTETLRFSVSDRLKKLALDMVVYFIPESGFLQDVLYAEIQDVNWDRVADCAIGDRKLED